VYVDSLPTAIFFKILFKKIRRRRTPCSLFAVPRLIIILKDRCATTLSPFSFFHFAYFLQSLRGIERERERTKASSPSTDFCSFFAWIAHFFLLLLWFFHQSKLGWNQVNKKGEAKLIAFCRHHGGSS
jgi:hypothetical protein